MIDIHTGTSNSARAQRQYTREMLMYICCIYRPAEASMQHTRAHTSEYPVIWHPQNPQGRVHLGKSSLWFQVDNQIHPSVQQSLTQDLSLPPGSQVQPRDGATVDKVSWVRVGHEDVVLGHGGDASVVTDDARKGDTGQGLSLLGTEHTWVLPPKPAWEHHGHHV